MHLCQLGLAGITFVFVFVFTLRQLIEQSMNQEPKNLNMLLYN